MRTVLVMLLWAGKQASAHHAFGGEFDANRPPHAWIHVEVTKPDGTKEVWMVEGGSPNSLLRRGVTKTSLPEGTEVVVDGYQARDHTVLRANGRNVTLADGRKLFLGSSGPGEPPEDAVPTEQAKPPAP